MSNAGARQDVFGTHNSSGVNVRSAMLPLVRPLLVALGLCVCQASAAFAQGSAQATATGDPLTYAGAVQQALAANPSILAIRLKRAINVASRDVAAERLNPEVRAEFAKETPNESYTLAWPWETGGKRTRRIAVSEAALLTGDAELNATIAQVEADVRKAFFDRYLAESRQTLLADMATLAQRLRDAAQARVDTGDAPRLELLQAELVYADAQNQATAAAGLVAAARTTLNALLGLPLADVRPIDATIVADDPVPVAAALARARQGNAELAVFDRRIEEQRTRIALAEALRQPDITPEATLTHRAEPEFNFGWRAAVAISLPILTRHKAGVVVEQAALAQLTSERDAAVARISGEVSSAVAIADAQRQQYVRYRDQILPQALEVERMADDSYRLGQTNLAAYLQALQSTRDVRLRALQSAADLATALADLDRAIGSPPFPAPVSPGPATPAPPIK